MGSERPFLSVSLFALFLASCVSAGCIFEGGRKLATRPDPPRDASTYLSFWWYDSAWFVRHYYGDRMAEEYYNQPETLWHTNGYGRGESFADTFFYDLLSLDEEGQRCLAYRHSRDLSAGPVTIDCVSLWRFGKRPWWVAERRTGEGAVRIYEYADFKPRRLTYYYEVRGRIVAMESYQLTLTSPNWFRPDSRGRPRDIRQLMAEDEALEQKETLVYREAVLTQDLPDAVIEALAAQEENR